MVIKGYKHKKALLKLLAKLGIESASAELQRITMLSILRGTMT